MAFEPEIARYCDAAENERRGRPANPVHVPAEAGAEFPRSSRCGLPGHFLGKEEPREVHVGRSGDLQIAVAALDHAHLHLFEPLHQTRLVGSDEPVLPRHVESALQQIEAEDLRRLGQH